MKFLVFLSLFTIQEVAAFVPHNAAKRTSFGVQRYNINNEEEIKKKTSLYMATEKVGIFFGTSTGATEAAAHALALELGSDVAAGPFEIDSLKGDIAKKFDEYDSLIVGTPTWNTGADTERSGTGWDEIYYSEMQDLKIHGKKVAVFGLGDSEGYAENYADASGELHDVFESLGCKLYGYTSPEGYDHEESKAIRDGKFCGLLLDSVNQEDLTEGRVQSWVSQLNQEGFLDGDSAEPSTVAATAAEAIDTVANEKIGIFFGTSTGSTEAAAYAIASELGSDVAEGPFEIDSLKGNIAKKFGEYNCLLVGTPTWNTGADTERSGTGWDEIYYSEMQNLKIQGKKVAVFGLGDSEGYAENYADASGELHDVFESLGCKLYGYTSLEGYEHEESKATRGDKFCGLLLDAVNQEDLTEGRVKSWVSQLNQEGFLRGDSSNASVGTIPEVIDTVVATPTPVIAATPEFDNNMASIVAELEKLEKENAKLRKMLEDNSRVFDNSIPSNGSDENGFVPHYNSKSDGTMWVSPDGRSCYYTASEPKISTFKP